MITVWPIFFAADKVRLYPPAALRRRPVHADLSAATASGGLAVITGHHDNVCKATSMQSADGILSFAAQRIKDTDHGRELPKCRDKGGILAGRDVELFIFALRALCSPRLQKTKRALPMMTFCPPPCWKCRARRRTAPENDTPRGSGRGSGFVHDGVRHRVRIVLFQTGRQAQHFAPHGSRRRE